MLLGLSVIAVKYLLLCLCVGCAPLGVMTQTSLLQFLTSYHCEVYYYNFFCHLFLCWLVKILLDDKPVRGIKKVELH